MLLEFLQSPFWKILNNRTKSLLTEVKIKALLYFFSSAPYLFSAKYKCLRKPLTYGLI